MKLGRSPGDRVSPPHTYQGPTNASSFRAKRGIPLAWFKSKEGGIPRFARNDNVFNFSTI
jgi:hypothetical protein